MRHIRVPCCAADRLRLPGSGQPVVGGEQALLNAIAALVIACPARLGCHARRDHCRHGRWRSPMAFLMTGDAAGTRTGATRSSTVIFDQEPAL